MHACRGLRIVCALVAHPALLRVDRNLGSSFQEVSAQDLSYGWAPLVSRIVAAVGMEGLFESGSGDRCIGISAEESIWFVM